MGATRKSTDCMHVSAARADLHLNASVVPAALRREVGGDWARTADGDHPQPRRRDAVGGEEALDAASPLVAQLCTRRLVGVCVALEDEIELGVRLERARDLLEQRWCVNRQLARSHVESDAPRQEDVLNDDEARGG